MAPDGYEAPVFSSTSEVPQDWEAEIHEEKSYASWQGTTAVGGASMLFVGNRISQTVVLTVVAGTQTVGTSTPATSTQTFVLPFTGRVLTNAEFAVSNDCGQVVNTSSQHLAKLMIFAGADFISLDEEHRVSQASARQRACRQTERCGDVTQVTYSPDDPDCQDEGDGGGQGGDDIGTGVFYQPGESTGGTTVDFGTGEGLTASSLCGTAAVVEYVCIDVLNSEGIWEEWACGYVTTC